MNDGGLGPLYDTAPINLDPAGWCVPTYHFRLQGDDPSFDSGGVELANDATAWAECLKTAGQIIVDMDARAPLRDAWTFETTDEAGQVLFRVALTMVDMRNSPEA